MQLLHRVPRRRLNAALGHRLDFYSAFPKSASRHLVALLTRVSGGRVNVVRGKTAGGAGNNLLDRRRILGDLRVGRHTLVYGHFPCSRYNLDVMRRCSATPRVLVSIRPLADVVVSYKEHVDRLGRGPLDPGLPGRAEGLATWQALSDVERYEHVIDTTLPWYLQHVAGWLAAPPDIPVLWLRFEQITGDGLQVVQDVDRFLGYGMDRAVLRTRFAEARDQRSNFNQGLAGRGAHLLGAAQLRRLHELSGRFAADLSPELRAYLAPSPPVAAVRGLGR